MKDRMDSLPPHLQHVMKRVEQKYGEAQHDLHVPKECREAQALDRDSCMKVMFKVHAPQECIEALERGEITFTNERQARETCEEIMFKANAPPECIEAGLRDHRDCSKLMFKTHAPKECVDAGLTGEDRSDERR